MTQSQRDLNRFLRPASVAVVGASERQQRSNNAVESMLGGPLRLWFVNPGRDEVYGERSYASLSQLPEPVDAVLSLVPAEAAIDVVADARAAGAGGVVVVAGGFAEEGDAGIRRQDRLREAAGDLPVLGPNCNGFIRPGGARLSGAPVLPFPRGNIGVVTHSGALLGVLGLAAQERGVGYSSLISTGNEMDVDMADAVSFLADDPETQCIVLVVETVRAPQRFFSATRRAIQNGKPVVALKLGRSQRGQEIASSHTGALAGEAWVYEAAFAQHGIAVASDIVDLLDRVALLSQLTPDRWRTIGGVAMASLSGGWATMASDICAEEGVELPALDGLADEVNSVLPGRTTINPLDMTGFVMGKADVVDHLLGVFEGSDEVDAIVLQWFLDESAGESGAAFIEAATKAAARTSKPVIIGSVEDGHPGTWARDLPSQGVGIGRGLRATARALHTMDAHLRYRDRLITSSSEPRPSTSRSLAGYRTIRSESGSLISFADTMSILSDAGITVSPFSAIGSNVTTMPTVDFDGPYVAKLADVAHRSDIGAVLTQIEPTDLGAAVARLRSIAAQHDVPADVIVQPQQTILGEAFIGIQADSGLGPLVVFGIGGVFVELLGKVAGRLAPLADHDIETMMDEMADTGVFAGARGSRPWPREQLAEALRAASRIAIAHGDELHSVDINPLALTQDGFVALDGLIFVR